MEGERKRERERLREGGERERRGEGERERGGREGEKEREGGGCSRAGCPFFVPYHPSKQNQSKPDQSVLSVKSQ